MRLLSIGLLVLCSATFIVCPPVKEAPKEKKEQSPLGVEYEHYLQEVFKELENDAEFKKRAEAINKTEDIAQQLDFVHHSVRSKLDEIKRKEVDRLNELEKMLKAKKSNKDIEAGGAVKPADGVYQMDRKHIDHSNPHTFEISDLEALVKKVTNDLSEVDQKQEEEYKKYEMEKEHLKKRKINKIKDPKKKHDAEEKLKESKARHEKHPKIHQPGSAEQMKEVWEKEDHLDKDSFDPVTFFNLHDTDGNGLLDETEIEALMQKELGKVYDPENPDDDENEKYHEMMRMRQEAFKLMDTNQDDLISLDEFKEWTKSPEFKKDGGWKTSEELDKKPYDEDEFKKFEEEYDREHPDEDDDEDEKHHGAAAPDAGAHAQVDPPAPAQTKEHQDAALKFKADEHAAAGKAAPPPAAKPQI